MSLAATQHLPLHAAWPARESEEPDAPVAVAPGVAERVERAFAVNPGAGLFHLGAVETTSALPPTHAFFRDLAKDFVTTLCAESAAPATLKYNERSRRACTC